MRCELQEHRTDSSPLLLMSNSQDEAGIMAFLYRVSFQNKLDK